MNQPGEVGFQPRAQANPNPNPNPIPKPVSTAHGANPARGDADYLSKNQLTTQNPTGFGPVAPIEFTSVINQITPFDHIKDLVLNSAYQFITGYDSFSLSSSLAAFGVKARYGTEAVPIN
jgi:hypothetical protein